MIHNAICVSDLLAQNSNCYMARIIINRPICTWQRNSARFWPIWSNDMTTIETVPHSIVTVNVVVYRLIIFHHDVDWTNEYKSVVVIIRRLEISFPHSALLSTWGVLSVSRHPNPKQYTLDVTYTAMHRKLFAPFPNLQIMVCCAASCGIWRKKKWRIYYSKSDVS